MNNIISEPKQIRHKKYPDTMTVESVSEMYKVKIMPMADIAKFYDVPLSVINNFIARHKLKRTDRTSNKPKKHIASASVNLDTYRFNAGTRSDTEPCAECGKPIYFTSGMSKADYAYKRDVYGIRKFYCGWSHLQKARGD